MNRGIWIGVLLVLLPVVSAAQTTDHGFVRGLGGVTFGTETAGAAGGSFGVTVIPQLDVIGEFGWVQNVLPKALQEDIDNVVNLLSIILRVPISVDVKVPTFYGFGGVRANVPTGGRVRPFVEGAGGFGRITLDVDARAAGINISDEVEDAIDADSETKFLMAVGGGINIGLTSSVGVDIGYRFLRIFTDDPAINASQVYGGVRVGF
jgi:hypothetical protein